MKLQNTTNTFDFLKNKTRESYEHHNSEEESEISEIFSFSKKNVDSDNQNDLKNPENLKRKYIENDNEESILCDNVIEQIHKPEPKIPKIQELMVIKPRRKIIKLVNVEPLYEPLNEPLNERLNELKNIGYNPRTRMCHTCDSLPCKSKKGHAICKGCDNQGLIYAYPMGGYNNCRMRCANCNSSNFHTFYNAKNAKK